MTPKEKAIELVNKFSECGEDGEMYIETAKKCSITAVDEILKIVPYSTYKETLCPYDGAELSTKYWQEVKSELEKL